MKKDQDKAKHFQELRNRAEKSVLLEGERNMPPEDTQRLIHELNVRQIELEMQNEDLGRAHREIKESRDRYYDLFDLAPIGYLTIDEDGLIQEINLTGADFFGIERRYLLKRAFSLFVAGDNQHLFSSHRQEVLKTGTRQKCELKLVKKDGTSFYAHLQSTPVQDDEGNFKRLRVALIDITEQKSAEEELRKYRVSLEELVKDRTNRLLASDKQLQQETIEHKKAGDALDRSVHQNNLILEAVGEGIYGVDLQGNTTFINPAALNMSGYRSEELIGRRQHEIFHHSKPDGSPYPHEECPIYATMKDGISRRSDIEVFWKKDGTSFPVEYVSTPIQEKGQIIGAVVVFKDITGRKRMEEEKEKMQAQLLQSQKMEAIGLLAGGIAHDFNNLLAIIQGCATLAMMKVNESDPLSMDLNQIHLAAGRASNLIRQLLLFSRKQPVEPVSLDLNRTIDNLLKMLHRLIGEDIGINTILEPDLWLIRADEGNIEQMIVNLSINARDAMPLGGQITIKTENVTLDEESSGAFPEARPGRFVCLSIGDTGIGIEKEAIDRIFEPFFTTKGVGKGTGLGLSVAYGIIRQHAGWVNVSSRPGKGSIFEIYLPAFPGRLEKDIEEVVSLKGLQGKGERILMVEDEKEVRQLTARLLRQNGYMVIEAQSAQGALAVFEQERGNITLILSDVVLPDQTGLELAEQLLVRQPKLLVILTSGYLDQKSQWSAIHGKGFRFLQKPCALPDMLRSIREAIESSSKA